MFCCLFSGQKTAAVVAVVILTVPLVTPRLTAVTPPVPRMTTVTAVVTAPAPPPVPVQTLPQIVTMTQTKAHQRRRKRRNRLLFLKPLAWLNVLLDFLCG